MTGKDIHDQIEDAYGMTQQGHIFCHWNSLKSQHKAVYFDGPECDDVMM